MAQLLLGTILALTSTFLILLVLVQRGRGGGLAGALGGMGGQSAFGAKSGDVFTKITIVVATIWIILCVFLVKMSSSGGSDPLAGDLGRSGEPQSAAASGLSTESPESGGSASEGSPEANKDATAPAGSAPGTSEPDGTTGADPSKAGTDSQ